MLVDRM